MLSKYPDRIYIVFIDLLIETGIIIIATYREERGNADANAKEEQPSI